MTESEKRKQYLIKELRKLAVYNLPDSRKVDNNLSLYTLEWVHITEKGRVARQYGNNIRDSRQA